MGYTTRPNGIRDYSPDDTDTTMYLYESATLSDMMAFIDEKWPGTSMSRITISSQYIHTQCIGYDLHDPMDWTNYLIITKTD